MLARDGPQSEVVTWASVKLTPWSPSNRWTFFITAVPSERSSSLRMRTTLSRLAPACRPADTGLAATAPSTPKTSSNAVASQIHTALRTKGWKLPLFAKRCVRLVESGTRERLAVVVADRDRPYRRLLLQPKHRLD